MKINSKSLFSNLRNDINAAIVEFVGTTLWLLLALGGIQAATWTNQDAISTATKGHVKVMPSADQLLYSAASMGLSLLVSAWLFYRASGGVFNPNISTALLLAGVIGPVRWVLYCIAQLAGAIAASALLLALLPGPLVVNTVPAPGINSAQAVFIEAFMTAALVLVVLMLAVEKHSSTPSAPVGIGLTLFAGMLWGNLYTGCAMNSARAFGPAVVTGFDHQHWVYWVGPFIGSLIATCIYRFLKHIKYLTLNPDQDAQNPVQSPSSLAPNSPADSRAPLGNRSSA